jgi:hypothetical protein
MSHLLRKEAYRKPTEYLPLLKGKPHESVGRKAKGATVERERNARNSKFDQASQSARGREALEQLLGGFNTTTRGRVCLPLERDFSPASPTAGFFFAKSKVNQIKTQVHRPRGSPAPTAASDPARPSNRSLRALPAPLAWRCHTPHGTRR